MLIGWLGRPVSAEVEVKDVYTICATRGEAESVNGIGKERGSGVRNLLTVINLIGAQDGAAFLCWCTWAAG